MRLRSIRTCPIGPLIRGQFKRPSARSIVRVSEKPVVKIYELSIRMQLQSRAPDSTFMRPQQRFDSSKDARGVPVLARDKREGAPSHQVRGLEKANPPAGGGERSWGNASRLNVLGSGLDGFKAIPEKLLLGLLIAGRPINQERPFSARRCEPVLDSFDEHVRYVHLGGRCPGGRLARCIGNNHNAAHVVLSQNRQRPFKKIAPVPRPSGDPSSTARGPATT